MNNFFVVNNILRFKDEQRLERILWISEKHTYCYTIVINISKLKINAHNMETLYEECEANNIEVLINDPTYRVVLESNISEKSKQLMEKMYEMIECLASENNEPDVFDESTRRKKVLEAAKKFKISEPTIYKHLRLYWQGGRLRESLIPQYNNCGGKGKEKKLGDRKVGRPTGTPKSKKDLFYLFEEDDLTLGEGINITEEIKDIFRVALQKYHKNRVPLSTVYQCMLGDYFSEIVDDNGVKVRRILPDDKIPKYGQLRYWAPKLESKEGMSHSNNVSNGNEKKDLITESGIRGKSHGAGFRFEIDATYSQVYLVNSMDGSSGVGEAVYYFVVDEFSTYVNGVEVTLNKPSGEGAMKALYSCTLDKVELCKRYGLDISEEEWPYPGMVRKLVADNGELAGLIPEKAIKNLRIEMVNARSYRPTDKPIVERLFRTIKDKLRPFVPGMVKKGRKEPGERDKREDAVLNLDEFTKIILRAVIWHNNTKLDNDYKLTEELIKDGVPKIPVEIYKWSITHFSGAPIHFDDNFLKLNLMTSGKAAVTSEGVMFNTLYDCNIARVEEWYSQAKKYGTWKVDIRFDRGNLDNIYIINPNGNEFEVGTMKNINDSFKNKSFEEISQYRVVEKRRDRSLNNINNQRTSDFFIGVQNDVKSAIKKYNGKARTRVDKKEVVKNLVENGRDEKEALNKEQAFKLENQNNVINKNNNGEKALQNTKDSSPSKLSNIWRRSISE